jgi:hypothetical protein
VLHGDRVKQLLPVFGKTDHRARSIVSSGRNVPDGFALMPSRRTARRLADSLAGRGARLDQLLSEFTREYVRLRADLAVAHAAGYGPAIMPTEMTLSGAVARALAGIREIRIDTPPGAKHTFDALVKGWSTAARGAVPRLLGVAPVAVPSAPALVPPQQRNPGDPRKLPIKTDIGERLPGDPPEFQVKMPRRSA